MKAVRLDLQALNDLRIASRYYEDKHPNLGSRFLTSVRASLSRIARLPQSYRTIRGPWKICAVGKFPYAIVYRTLETNIYVIAVVHQKRRPEYLLERLDDSSVEP